MLNNYTYLCTFVHLQAYTHVHTYIHMYNIHSLNGVIIITIPASPLPIELVAATENVY